MVNTKDLSKKQMEELSFTVEELKEIENARTMPIVFDKDCSETTPEKALRFRRANPPRHVNFNNPA